MLIPLAFTRLKETAMVIGGANAAGLLVTTVTETHKLTDLVGVGSFVLATAHLTSNHPLVIGNGLKGLTLSTILSNRVLLVNGLVCLWGSRLAGYLFHRIMYTGEDKRLRKFYREEGEGWLDSSRSNYPLGLGFFWSIQALWGWIGTLPVTLLNSATAVPVPTNPILSWLPIAGMVTAFALETVADYQKYKFKSEPKNSDKWCNVGLWSLARFPNYFSEMLFWWSTFFAAVPSLLQLAPAGSSPLQKALPVALGAISPMFVSYLLMNLSGVPIHERNNNKKHGSNPAYQEYVKKTNLLIPFPKF